MEKDDSYFWSSATTKVKIYLKLDDVKRAKENLLKSKEICDKSKETGSDYTKIILYNLYYSYYSHPEVNNLKKALQNFVQYFNVVLKLKQHKVIFIGFHSIIRICIENRAYRQLEYLLRAIKALFDKIKSEFDNPETIELKLLIQQLNHMINLFNVMIDEGGNSPKLSKYFVPLEIDLVPVEGNPLLDGSFVNFAGLKEIYSMALNKLNEAKSIFEVAKNFLNVEDFNKAKGSIEKFEELLK